MAFGDAPDGGAIGGSIHMKFDTMAECIQHKGDRIAQNGILTQSMICLPDHSGVWGD